MAWTSGTASDYLDLLTRLKAFVTEQMLPANERWQVMRWVPGPPAELVLKGVGLAGSDEIYVAIQTETSSDYGNWKLRGFVGWNPAQTFDGQYNPSGTFYALLMASAMSMSVIKRSVSLPNFSAVSNTDTSWPRNPAICQTGTSFCAFDTLNGTRVFEWLCTTAITS